VQEVTIARESLETWAAFLLDHSLGGITPDDRVMIKGQRIAWPLLQILERRVIEAGATPDVYLIPPNNERGRIWSASMGQHGIATQFERSADWLTQRYESMTKYVEVLGEEAPESFANLTPVQAGALATADRPFSTVRLSKNWVITLYPTPRDAELEGLALDDYVNFIVGASTTDPDSLRQAEERIKPYMAKASEMTIVTHHPHEDRELTLVMSLAQSRPILSYGLRNFPDGEIFTSPDANTPEGEIFLDLPIRYSGKDIQGIYLKLESGRITSYSAQQGMETLSAIIETDDGSHRLGEIALGMNPGMERVLKHPLFVEKVGGTLHLAIGQSYVDGYVENATTPEGEAQLETLVEAGVANRSAQHVDLVCDFRAGGCGRRVSLDQHEMIIEDGLWVPE
jgi:aminopeptidase